VAKTVPATNQAQPPTVKIEPQRDRIAIWTNGCFTEACLEYPSVI
jgi:hypothetical protein